MKKRIYPIILSLTIVLNYSCKQNAIEEKPSVQNEISNEIVVDRKQFESSNFALGKIEQISIDKNLPINGMIHLPEKSKAFVSTILSGTVGKMNLIEGQKVTKGQRLFSVTNPNLINIQEEYLIAKNNLAFLKETYNRQQELASEQLTTKKEVLKAKTELTTTQSKLASLEKKLKLYGINSNKLSDESLVSTISIYAPISGYITDISAIQGMYLESNVPALKIENNDDIYLELSVLEKDVHLLKKDQKIYFTTQGNMKEKHTATINLINKYIDANHMVKINCDLDDVTDTSLIPGMFANANIVLNSYKTNALPESALIKSEGMWNALRLKEEKGDNFIFEQININGGQIQNGYIEIKDYDNDSHLFLTKGAYFLIQ